MLVVFKSNIGPLKLAAALYIDRMVRVDEDVRDSSVFQQGLDGSKPKQLMLDIVDQPFALGCGQRHRLLGEYAFSQARNFRMHLVGLERRQLGQVHPVDECAMKTRLHLLKRGLPVAVAAAGTDRARNSFFY